MKTDALPAPETTVELSRTGPHGRQLWTVGLPVSLDRSVAGILDAALQQDLPAAGRTLATLEGAFAVFLWDPRERRALVVNDFAGLQPLYMRRVPGGVMFAPRIEALAGAASPDPTGWGAFVGFGHFVGERTSVEGVTRIPPASRVEYDAAADVLTVTPYWQWPEIDPTQTLERVDTGGLLEILDASLRSYDVYGATPTLLLSGGFESRLIAALLTRAGRVPAALTLRNPYEHLEIDGRFAARVARELRLPHTVRDPAPSFFSTPAYLDYVRRHEVASTSVNLFIAQVASELQAAGVTASWDGFPFGSIVKEKSGATFDRFVRAHSQAPDGPAWRAARRVFTGAFAAAMRDGLDGAVAREVAACHPAPHGTQQFFHRNRVRHRIAPNTLKVYAGFLLPLLPGLTRAFYERVVPIPPAVRRGEAVYLKIFERHFPRLARLPWCSGGHLMPGTHPDAAYRLLAARSAAVEHPRLGHILRRLRLVPARPRSSVVDEAVRRASPDDGFLNADVIRALQRTPPGRDPEDTFARELVFYWSMWRELMGSHEAGPYALAS